MDANATAVNLTTFVEILNLRIRWEC